MIKRTVILDGVLRGRSLEANCTVGAVQMVEPRGETKATRYRVLRVARELLDGPYDLLVNGETIKVRYAGGVWMAAKPD